MTEPSASLTVGMTTPDEAWAELNLHLTRSRALCLVFIYAADSRALMLLRTRLEDEWVSRSAPVCLIQPSAPNRAAIEVMQVLEHEVLQHPDLHAPVWLQLTAHDWRSDQPAWEHARHEVLYRLNEWRAWLQQTFRRPLIVALPLAWNGKVAEVAPDLWHVRTMSARLDIGARVLAMDLAQSWPRFLGRGAGVDAETVENIAHGEIDLRLAHDGVARARSELHEGGEAVRLDLAQRLMEFGHALLRQRDIPAAEQALKEAERLFESLCAASGDVRSFLSERVDAASLLGDAFRASGNLIEASAAYGRATKLLNTRSVILDRASAALSADLELIHKQAQALQQQGRYEEAFALYDGKSNELDAAGAFDLPIASLAVLATQFKMWSADMQALIGRRSDAIATYRRMVDLLTQRLAGQPEDASTAILLTLGLHSLEELLGATVQAQTSIEALQDCVDLWLRRPVIDEPELLDDLAEVLEQLFQARLMRAPSGTLDALATQPLVQALALRRHLVKVFPEQNFYQAALSRVQSMFDALSISSASQLQ